MAFRLPAPPPDSCFQTGEDEQGWPLLRWRPTADGKRWLYALSFGLGLCAWASWGLSIFLGAGDFQDWRHALGLACWVVGWFGGLVLGARTLLGLLRTPEPEHLLFKPAAGPNSRKSASTGWGCGGG